MHRTQDPREDMAYAMGVKAALQRLSNHIPDTPEAHRAWNDCEAMWQNRATAVFSSRADEAAKEKP